MNISKHIYSVKELLNNYDIPNRNSITNLFIEHLLNVEKSNILGDFLRRNQVVSTLNYNTICLKMTLMEKQDCLTDCIGLRSINRIPEYIGNLKIMYGENLVWPKSRRVARYRKSGLSKEKSISYYVQDGYLYIDGTTSLESVQVKAIFVSNRETNNKDVVDCNCIPCIGDYHLFIDPTLLDTLYSLVLKRILSLYGKGTESHPQKSTNNKDNV